MILEFDLQGTECNGWPRLRIKHNDQTVWHDQIIGVQTVSLDLDINHSDRVTLLAMEKNMLTDTVVDHQGNIVKDKSLQILDIRCAGVSMGAEWIRNRTFHGTDITEPFASQGFYSNGAIDFAVGLPVYQWIIEQKYCARLDPGLGLGSAGHPFDHDRLSAELSTLENMIHAHTDS